MATNQDKLDAAANGIGVWGYRNPDLEKDDAYALLRAVRDKGIRNEAILTQNQVEIRALKALVIAANANPNLTAEDITAAVQKGIEQGVVTVDVNVAGGTH